MTGFRGAGVVCVVAAFVALVPAASAHAPGLVFAGFGTATLDGAFAPGEWDGAAALPFTAGAPGGGSVSGELRVMNDGTNLYLGVRLATSLETTSVSFGFDNDHDGVWPEEGSDGIALGFGVRNGFGDLVLSGRGGCPASLCGFHDVDLGGTVDAAGIRAVAASGTTIELAKRLDSTDDLNDFSLGSGDVVGFGFQTGICTTQVDCVLTQPVPFVTGEIRVVGAAELLADLAAAVAGVGPGTSLAAKVYAALAAWERGEDRAARALLAALVAEVEAQAGKSIPTATAAALVAAAERAREAIGE